MLAAMSRASDPPATPAVESGEAIARRKLLKQAGWVVPAIVTTVTVSARAAQATCTPRSSEQFACGPVTSSPTRRKSGSER